MMRACAIAICLLLFDWALALNHCPDESFTTCGELNLRSFRGHEQVSTSDSRPKTDLLPAYEVIPLRRIKDHTDHRVELTVTVNWTNKSIDISAVYLQVCNYSVTPTTHNILYVTGFGVDSNDNWKVSTCTPQNEAVLITKTQSELQYDIDITLSLTSNPGTTLRLLVADGSGNVYGPINAYVHEESIDPITVKKKESRPHTTFKRDTQQASDYIVIANELYIHQLSLDGSRVQTLVSGLGFAKAIDYDFRQRYFYWTDTLRRSIMRSNLDGTNVATILDQNLMQPEGIAVDWINSKLYWTDVQTRWIGVMDLTTRYYGMLLSTQADVNPREIVVDPTTSSLYWAEWGTNVARIKSASMDGLAELTIHSTDLQRPYAITIDIQSQEIYWADHILDKIETSSVNGTGRRTLTTSGIVQAFSLSLSGSTLFISDWTFGVTAMPRAGGEDPTTIYNNFCNFVYAYGVRVVSAERQPQVENPCGGTNGGCSHFCLLSSVDPRGYSCQCPNGAVLDNDNLTCIQSTPGTMSPLQANMTGSCMRAGYGSCCIGSQCTGDSGDCFCDADCHLYGDCCEDIVDVCPRQSNNTAPRLVFSNTLYIQRLSLNGQRTRTVHSGLSSVIGIDYDYRRNYLYWSTSSELWRSRLDGSEALLLLNSDVMIVDDIAVDWTNNKLYWTDNGFDRIGVLDSISGYYSFLIDTGSESSPRGIIVDPVNRIMYWCDWGMVAKIEKASMDGSGREIIHNTGLIWPNGLSLDHTTQALYWIDADHDRIESSHVNGSNRVVIATSSISRPFSITVFRDMLYFTDRRTIKSVSTTGGSVQNVYNLCEIASGIEVVAEERQPTAINPCAVNNGGCSHICLLSSGDSRGYSCACHIGFSLDSDMATCSSDTNSTVTATVEPPQHGSCVAAGYTAGCCFSGLCRGSPPTCSCDPQCSIFQDCCSDFAPCPTGYVVTILTPGNTTISLNGQQRTFQLLCDVQSNEIPTIQWTFSSTLNPVSRQLSNGIDSLDPAYTVVLSASRNSSILTINNVGVQNDGIYTCTAAIGENSDQASSRITIQVIPSTPLISGNSSYAENDVALLECEVTTYPEPSIIWVKRGQNFGTAILNSQRTSISFVYMPEHPDGPKAVSLLMVSSLTIVDNGTYSCQVNTDIPGYATVSSHFAISVQNVDECERNSPCLNGGSCIHLDRGYECNCADSYTGRNCTEEILMNTPQAEPSLIEMPTNMSANIAAPVNLSCSAEGYPPPTYQWFKDGVAIPGETRSFLYIPELLPRERGSYSCEASNVRGQISSDYARVNISGIKQYVAILSLNQTSTSQAFEEALNAVTDFSSMDASTGIYALEILNTTMSGDAVFLVTTLSSASSSIPIHLFIQRTLEGTPAILAVTNLVRYDGCASGRVDGVLWPESDIGQIVQQPCPCEDFLQSGEKARRTCGGTYSLGGKWMDVDYAPCVTLMNQVTNTLCSIALDSGGSPEVRSQAIVNITSKPDNFTTNDVSITALVIEELTDDAITNEEVRSDYLTAIDNLQQVDRDVILDSETQNRSSSRLLESLERFLDEVEVDNLNTLANSTVTMFLQRTFALQVQSVNVSSLNGQTFNVDLGSVDDARNITEDIEDGDLITIENAMDALNNATAAIHVSEGLLEYCSRGRETQRLGYSVFLFDTFFRSQDTNTTIGSLIVSTRLKCGNNTSHPPVHITLRSSNEVNSSQGACTVWNSARGERFGAWSQSGCREVVRDGNKRVCECTQLGHFGILFDLNPADLPVGASITFTAISYIGVVLSLVCLIVFILSYLAVKKLRTSVHGQLLISMSFSLIGLYVIFIVGGQVTMIPALCGLSSALLHYFLLVFFSWTAVEAVWLYLKLVKIFGLHSIERRFITVSSLLSWLVPALVVIISAGAGHQYYVSEFYCRAIEWPFWFGLLLPILAIYLFNWIMFAIIIISICKHMNSVSKKKSEIGAKIDEKKFNAKNLMIAVVLSITFGLGWGVGFLATSHEITAIVIVFQGIFTVVVAFQGVLIFIFHGARSPEVQGLWKAMLLSLSRKTRKVYSFTQSTSESKSSKQTSITNSPSTDMLATPSTVKSPSTTFSVYSTDTMDTKIDFEPNPAYGDVKRKRKIEDYIDVNQNAAYETVKTDLSVERAVYETVN